VAKDEILFMLSFKNCEFIKNYFNQNNLKNIILISQARSGTTFATQAISRYIGFSEENLYPEEYFINRHFVYLKNFISKHKNFFININEFVYKRTELNRSDTLFIYLYRNPEEIMKSYNKARTKGYYNGWSEFYKGYRCFYPNISQDLDTASFNHEIWMKQQKYFTHCFNLNFNSLKELPGFINNRDEFTKLKSIGHNKVINVKLTNKLNFNFLEKFYYFLRRKLESRKKIIKNY